MAAVMLWFFVTAYAVLLGAELKAQIERHAASGNVEPAALVAQAV